MIKGRYVAQIEVDFTYDGGNVDYRTVHERLNSEWIDRTVTAVVTDVFKGGEPVVTVTKRYADITEINEDER